MTHHNNVLDRTDTPALLDRQIDDLLLRVRGLAVVRDLLAKRGASTDEVAAHSRELETIRARLAELIRGTGTLTTERPT
jgi:hypothetical protein